MKYHFITSKGKRIESNNLGELRLLAHMEPTNWVKIFRKDGYVIGAWGAKQYNKWLHRKMVREDMMNNAINL